MLVLPLDQKPNYETYNVTRFFASGFFIFPQAPKITLVWIFSKICGFTPKWRCTTGINDTGGKFAIGTAGAFDTSGKFATGENDTLPPVSTTQVASCHRYQQHQRQICHRCQQINSKSGQSRCKRVCMPFFLPGKYSADGRGVGGLMGEACFWHHGKLDGDHYVHRWYLCKKYCTHDPSTCTNVHVPGT